MLQFPLNHAEIFPWHAIPFMDKSNEVITTVSAVNLAATFTTSMATLMFYMCLIWIAAIVAAAIWYVMMESLVLSAGHVGLHTPACRCGYSFSQRSFRVLWPLKFLRLGAQVTTTILFIPMTRVLVSVFDCRGNAERCVQLLCPPFPFRCNLADCAGISLHR